MLWFTYASETCLSRWVLLVGHSELRGANSLERLWKRAWTTFGEEEKVTKSTCIETTSRINTQRYLHAAVPGRQMWEVRSMEKRCGVNFGFASSIIYDLEPLASVMAYNVCERDQRSCRD